MFHRGACQSMRFAGVGENKTRTNPTKVGHASSVVKAKGRPDGVDTRNQCSYVAAENWRYGGADPFCNAPVVAGTAYCVRHFARCAAALASSEALALEADLARAADDPPPPPELGFLAEAALPEQSPDDPRDIRALLDVEPPDRGGEE